MILKLAVKGGIVAGTFYYTKQLGVWGSSNETEQLYCKISKSIQPYAVDAKKKMPFEIPPLPKTGEMRFLAKHYYNQGVKSSIHFIYMIPCYTGQLMKKAKDAVNSALDASPGNASSSK